MATWSGIKNKLENEYLAESLRGRIQYFATTYRESHDQEGRAAIRYDGKEIVSGSWFCKDEQHDENTFIVDDFKLNKGAFDQRDFYLAFHKYDNQSIEKSLQSEDLIVRIFAILDKRVGKRRLIAMRSEVSTAPEAFQLLYSIRSKAEGIS